MSTQENTNNRVTLYIATHNITGKKYFGKTTRYFTQEDLQKYYHGSGLYWKNHIKKHGNNITMEIYGIYNLDENSKDYVKPIALKFSKENNIVEDYDNWANQMEEDGLRGGKKSIRSIIRGTRKMKETKNSKKWKETKGEESSRKAAVTKSSKEWKNKVSGINHPRVCDIYIFNNNNELVFEVSEGITNFLKKNEMPTEAFQTSYRLGGRPLFINKASLTRSDKKYHKYKGWYALKDTKEVTFVSRKNMTRKSKTSIRNKLNINLYCDKHHVNTEISYKKYNRNTKIKPGEACEYCKKEKVIERSLINLKAMRVNTTKILE